MLNIGFSELLLFGIIALVILGPDKLPTAVRTAGRWYARLRFMVSNLQQDIEKELQLAELREHMQQELDRIKLIEAQMQVQLNQMSGELAELNHTSPGMVDTMNAQPVIAKTATVKTMAITYLLIKPPLATSSVPYTIAHGLKQNRCQPPINSSPQPIMRLQVETA